MAVSAGRDKSLTRCYSGVKSRRGRIETAEIALKCAAAQLEITDLTGPLKSLQPKVFGYSYEKRTSVRISHGASIQALTKGDSIEMEGSYDIFSGFQPSQPETLRAD